MADQAPTGESPESTTEGTFRTGRSILFNYVAVMISGAALAVSFLTSYNNSLKPFELSIRVSPQVQLQWKGNLGLYIDIDLFNKSPKNGLVTRLALVVYKTTAEADKYLLEMNSFRVVGTGGTYGPSEETLPLFLVPWQRLSRTTSFIYDVPSEQFPASTGTYQCELLVWIDDGYAPAYREGFRFELAGDILDKYVERRKSESTTLQPIPVVGYTPFKSRKLAPQEYELLAK